jgi:hypothetical protein
VVSPLQVFKPKSSTNFSSLMHKRVMCPIYLILLDVSRLTVCGAKKLLSSPRLQVCHRNITSEPSYTCAPFEMQFWNNAKHRRRRNNSKKLKRNTVLCFLADFSGTSGVRSGLSVQFKATPEHNMFTRKLNFVVYDRCKFPRMRKKVSRVTNTNSFIISTRFQ